MLPLGANEDTSNPYQPHKTGNDTIDNFTGTRAITGASSEFESKTAVDDTKGDSDAADPDVCMCPHGSTSSSLVENVVHPAQGGLEEENGEKDQTNDGVVVAELVCTASNVDTETDSSDVDDIGKGLESCVDPDQARERGYADKNGTDGEEDDEGEGSEDSVSNDHCASVGATGSDSSHASSGAAAIGSAASSAGSSWWGVDERVDAGTTLGICKVPGEDSFAGMPGDLGRDIVRVEWAARRFVGVDPVAFARCEIHGAARPAVAIGALDVCSHDTV